MTRKPNVISRNHLVRVALGVLLTLLGGSVLLGVTVMSTTAADAPWPTFAHDAQRSSVGSDQTPFSGMRLAWRASVDGDVYAQPLIYNGMVFVATENNSVYAFDAAMGTPRWHKTLGTAVLQSDVGSSGSIPCSNIGPTIGITGTPVIDAVSGRLYVVGYIRAPQIHYELWTFDATTGTQVGTPVTIDPWPGTASQKARQAVAQLQRPALLLANGYVYVGFGGWSRECGTFSGWMAAIPVNPGTELTWKTPVNPSGASIWSPGGPSLDRSNNVWVSTGNGDKNSTGVRDTSESVLKFSPTLTLLDSFTPSDWVQLNTKDQDLGSFTPAHLTNGIAFHIGKAGVAYLLDEAHLGHSYPSGQLGAQLFSQAICGTAGGSSLVFAVAAWSPPNLYVPCIERIRRLQVTTTRPPGFTVAATGPNNSYTGTTVLAYGAVWNVNPTVSNGTFVSGTLNAYDAQTLALRQQIPLRASNGANLAPAHFAAPAPGYGRMYVAAGHEVQAYALSLIAPPTPTPTRTSTPTSIKRLNAGGPAYTGGDGQVWQADTGFSGGNTYSTTASIASTSDPTLYRSERYGNFSYSLSVPNGTYAVTLKFAEIYWSSPGQRVFNVSINGQQVLTNFDILANVAKNAAVDRTFSANVANGAVTITFSTVVDNAKVSAIEVVQL